MYETYHSGWIECITGSMFSGKSEELIRRQEEGYTRSRNIDVVDDGNELEAINISTSRDILLLCLMLNWY